MKVSPYPRYKLSGVKWLGEVPEHWNVKKLRYLCTVQTGDKDTVDSVEGGIYPFFVRSQTVERIDSFTFDCEAVLTAGDGAGVGKVFHHYIGPFDFHQRVYMLNSFRGVSGRFLFYFLKEQFHKVALEGNAKSTVDSLRMPLFLDFPIPHPTLGEQHSIAAFLDVETDRIDRLIVKKLELIERLREKRTALISRTVEVGLPSVVVRSFELQDTTPSLKTSGLEWLGDIPRHWHVKKFSREVEIAEGQVNPEVEPYASMLLVGPEHVESASGRLLRRQTAADQAAESGKYLCREGDVIYSKIRPALRKVTIAPEDCLCSADMYPLRARKRLNNHFIFWLFLSKQFFGWSVLESDRVAMPKINRDTLNELRMPIPPLAEQVLISDFLRVETSKLDAMMQKVEEAVERLQEYRSALITAAVTGKIDVRKAAS